MAPAVTNSPNPPQDPTGLLINTAMAATTQVVNTKLDQLLSAVTSPLTGNGDIDRALEQISRDLESLTSTQSREQEEIKKLLEDALNTEVLHHLTKHMEQQIDSCINDNVAKLVEAELERFIPKELRDKVDHQRSELLSVQVKIHNAEARRSNSFIKTPKQFGETLQYLINDKGARSDLFPKSVKELLELDDTKVVDLVKFFGMGDPDLKSKVPNLNWFLREIGVTYQSNLLG